jgi:hypothetical protein
VFYLDSHGKLELVLGLDFWMRGHQQESVIRRPEFSFALLWGL